jgi:hypothetical protein
MKFDFRKLVGVVALCALPLTTSWATTCHESETLKTLQGQSDYRGALQDLDQCVSASETPSQEELSLLNELVKQVLTVTDSTSQEEAYRNFQVVLKSHLLKGVEFEFADHFNQNSKDDEKLFSDVRQAEEKYYFYYDTGRMWSHSRGIALTDKAILWKNLTGDPQRLAFDELKSMMLIHELGLSLTGWKIRLNDNEAYEIRLSGIPDQAVQPFLTSIIYFINANKSSEQAVVALEVPEREVAILAGWVTLCRDKIEAQDAPIKDLQLLDACFATYGKDFKLSKTDNEWLNQLTSQIFEQTDVTFEEGYSNFMVVLSTHFFSDLAFKFKENFDQELKEKLFQEVKGSESTYYFYFDTGKATSGSRGIALTDQAIVWKNMLGSSISWNNLTGSASRVAFDEISKVSLIHELGLSSITGWKLRLNDNGDHDIVLAQLTEENVEMFAKAIVYFINIAAKASLILDIPQETQDILTKTFLERHPEIKSVTDSIFGAIMPSKTGEETEETEEADDGIVNQAKEKVTEGMNQAKEFVEKAAGEVGKAASEVGKSVKDMATEASSVLGTMISGEKKSEEEASDEASEDEASENEASEDEASEDEASENEASEDEASEDEASEDEASEDEASEDEASEDEESEDEASEDEASDDEESDSQDEAAEEK